ncbi:hypothetical protein FJR48_07625 [Sulfurimonas lithotrophica]|uniref:Uncharacterized protein n=2 Tax=Sulfurimonas lithotrophica TaxID=2590022 RepID=A0A5P8P206_9BACT|nr:hypothetical protein FJR48_07625 [Sulfurimonas lithotrophica]
MQEATFHRIVSFLLGASWAVVLFGALITFKSFLFMGFFTSVFFSVCFIFFSLFMILALDAFVINRKRLDEAKKQTKLLEDLTNK